MTEMIQVNKFFYNRGCQLLDAAKVALDLSSRGKFYDMAAKDLQAAVDDFQQAKYQHLGILSKSDNLNSRPLVKPNQT